MMHTPNDLRLDAEQIRGGLRGLSRADLLLIANRAVDLLPLQQLARISQTRHRRRKRIGRATGATAALIACPPEYAPFPPVPGWQPGFAPALDAVIERVQVYSNGRLDFAVFANGTVAVLPDGLSNEQAVEHATAALHRVFHAHPDMSSTPMKDGNIFVQLNHGVAIVVFEEVVKDHWEKIDRRHLDALATREVLITPSGPNKFDDFGKRALYGRCYMFVDAQAPKIVRMHRHA